MSSPRGRVAGVLERAASLPLLATLLAAYLLTRLWGWAVISVVGLHQDDSPWGEGPWGYLQMIGMWDSGWYEQIAEGGYPETLPEDASGRVMQNPWAFYPLFPLLTRGLMALTGWDFAGAGGTLALLCGAALTPALYLLFLRAPAAARAEARTPSHDAARAPAAAGSAPAESRWQAAGELDRESGRGPDRESNREPAPGERPAGLFAPLLRPTRELRWTPFCATLLVLLSPVSVILQIPYAEALGMALLAWLFVLVLAGRPGWAALLLTPLCLSRPVGVPVAAALGLWWCWKVLRRRRGPGSEDGRAQSWAAAFRAERRWLALALFACGAALFWPGIAWISTGRMDAYTATETAWRGSDLAPLVPWWTQAQAYLGPAGPLILLILLTLAALAMYSSTVLRTLPGFLRTWCWCYLGYLLIFLFPQSSTFRLLLPLFPVALPLSAVSTSRAYRVLLLLGAAVGQLIWVGWLWHWRELPGGGDFPP